MIKKKLRLTFKTRETQPAKETPGNTVDAPALLAQVDGHFGQVDTRTKLMQQANKRFLQQKCIGRGLCYPPTEI